MADDKVVVKKPAAAPRLRRSSILPRLRAPNLRRFRKTLERLGVTEDLIAMLPQITPYITSTLRLPRERVLTLLHMSDDPAVRKWLAVYEREDISDGLRRIIPYEVICAAATVPPLRLLECLGAMACRAGAQESAIKAALHHPQVVDATIGYALTEGGIQDRMVLHKATGFLPTPKGSTTTIQIQQQQAQVQAPPTVDAPIPEQTVRRLVSRFNEQETPALPESTGGEYIPMDDDESDEPEPEAVPIVNAMNPAEAIAKKFYDREGGRD